MKIELFEKVLIVYINGVLMNLSAVVYVGKSLVYTKVNALIESQTHMVN